MKKTISIILVIMIVLLVNACKKKQEPPTVVTEAATDITTTSFTAGGNVTDDGGDQIATRGICWDISDLPTIEKNILKVSGETGSFTCTISGLEPKTQYYVRAYATNSEGTSYGKPVSLTTLGDVPLTTVVDASDIGLYSAKLNGKINPHALSTEVVFQWGTTTDYGNGVSAIETPVTGNNQVSVSALLTGLDPGTTYHYRLVANNDLGTSQSEDISFTTNGSKPDIVIGDVTDIQVDGGKLNTVVNANYLETDVSFEWGTDTNYGNTITPASSPVSGNSDIDLSQVISGLTEGTVYHFRVVATNILGTTYSDDEKFTTLGKPAVATLGATEITTNSALTGGKIISDFGSPVTEMGICWSLSHDPAITDNKVMNDALADSFNISLSGLDPNTVYYVRAYAINDIGLSYGEEAIIKTYTGTITDIEGNSYYTVTINNQVWMAENLNTRTFNNGDPIPTTTPADLDISGENSPEYQWSYAGDEANAEVYGRLYTYYTVADTRGVCPTGWHVPTNNDIISLRDFLGGYLICGGKLKEAGTSHWMLPNTGATNETGFTGIPGGIRFSSGQYAAIYGTGQWWTSTEDLSTPDTDNAYSVNLASQVIVFGVGGSSSKSHGFSVRCLKD